MTAYLADELNRRDWRPREWESGTQAENAISRRIWQMLDPVTDPVLARVIVAALLHGASVNERKRFARVSLWGFLPEASPGPDLVLMDQRDHVRIVVENKSYAPPNAQPYRRFDQHPRFRDALAISLPERPGDDEHVTTGPWSNPFGTGPMLWQIDYYRCSTGWLRPQVTLTRADEVLWILLDRKGRRAEDLFPSAHTAHVWRTTGYDGFARRLFAGYDEAIAAGAVSRADGLKDLICMLAEPSH